MTLHGKNKASEKTSFFPDAGAFRTWGQKTNKRIPSNGGQRRATAFLPPVPSPALSGRLAVHAEFFIPGFQLEGRQTPNSHGSRNSRTGFPVPAPYHQQRRFSFPAPGQNIRNMAFQASPHKVPETASSAKNCLFFLVEHAPAAATSYFSASLRSREPLPTVRTVF